VLLPPNAATLAATAPMALVRSIISVQPFATQGILLCGYRHLLSKPSAHSGTHLSFFDLTLPALT